MNEQPPAGGFGVQTAAQPYAAPIAFGPMQVGQAGILPRPQSAFVAGILPIIISFFTKTALGIVGALLELYQLSLVGELVQLACIVWFAINAMRALGDLRAATNHARFPRWPTLIPLLGSIYWLSAVPGEVRKAKEAHGLPGTNRNLLWYLLFPVFAIQRDLNDLALARR